MNNQQKASLREALFSQTWNQQLAGDVISAIEKDLTLPETIKEPSKLQLALEKESIKQSQSTPDFTQESEE